MENSNKKEELKYKTMEVLKNKMNIAFAFQYIMKEIEY